MLRRDPNYWAKDLPIRRGLYNFDEIDIEYFRDANESVRSVPRRAPRISHRNQSWRAGSPPMIFPPCAIIGPCARACRSAGRRAWRALSSIAPGAVRRRKGSRSARALVRFRMDQRQSLCGLYRRTKSFFDEPSSSSTGRPASAAERRLLAPFPGAVRDDFLEGRWRPPVTDGSGRDRALAEAGARTAAAAGYALENGAPRQGRRAARLRDHGQGPQPGASRAGLCRIARADRRRGESRAGRRSAVSAPAAEVRFRHDDRHLARLAPRPATNSAAAGARPGRRSGSARTISPASNRPRSTR